MNNNRITVETTVNADPRKTWEYWTSPEHVTKWNFASEDWHCPSGRNDLRKGGEFSYTMAAKDGSFSFDFDGVYDEVVEEKKISFTMSDGRRVDIEFLQEGDSTRLVETFDPEQSNPAEFQKQGWQAILDNFKRHVEAE